MISFICVVLATFLVASALADEVPTKRKPHVVLILADDYGWANFGVHRRDHPLDNADARQGQLEVHTPNLDSLADEGVLLDRHYAYKICAPSRSSLQSGRLAVHVNTVNKGVTVRNVSDPVSGWAGIPRNMTGLAQKMRMGGYRTHMVGKWDAGMATPEHTPLGRGYETWLGYFQHANDYWGKGMPIQSTGEIDTCLNGFIDLFSHNATFRGGVRDGVSASQECLSEPSKHAACYEEQVFLDRALAVVTGHDVANSEAPLFLFYAFHLLHTPLQVPQAYLDRIDSVLSKSGTNPIDDQNRRLYAAMSLYMDEAVGKLVGALKAKAMWNDTLLIFLADNGGAIYEPGSGNNFPLRGGKYSDWEGGVRTNAFISGGFVPKARRGTTFSGVVSIADWYGTLCELAGVDMMDHVAERANEWLRPRGLPLLHPVESVPQWGFIVNGTNGRPEVLHLSQNAVLHWPYKLVTGKQPYTVWTGPLFPNCSSTVPGFYEDNGPFFVDLKVFGRNLHLGREEAQDRLTWTEDCGTGGCLYNVANDPEERNNLADDPGHAGVMMEMRAGLQRLNVHVFQPHRGLPALEACEVGVDNGGFYGPFAHVDGWYSPVPMSPGQTAKDATLKQLLRTVNSQALQKTVFAAAQTLLPLVRRPWAHRLDRCTRNTTSSSDMHGVPMLI